MQLQQLDNHAHIIPLIACVINFPEMCLVTEYCKNGDLLRYICEHKHIIANVRFGEQLNIIKKKLSKTSTDCSRTTIA